jgi:hypothetical protein
MIKKQGSKFIVTDSSGNKTLGTHPSKEKAQKQLAAIEISKAKHMKENKSFKAFRGTLSESEYSEVLTGYGNRSAHKDDAGLHHTNSPGAMAGINGMLAAIGRGTYLDPNQAFLKIKLRLNAVLLDFDWKNGSWDGGVGTYDIPVRQYGRVDGYDAATGGIRFDGRAAPTAGLKEFTMHCEVAEMDGLYTVTASISAAGMGMVGESVDDLIKSKSKELTWHAPKKSMAKIALNPNKKIGYTVTAIGPGGKKTVEKSVDEGFASAKKEIKRELAREQVPFFKGLEGPNRGRGTGYFAPTPVRLGKGRPAGAIDRKNTPATPVRLGKGRPAGAVSEELVGGQKKLDVNKNKRLDSQDFKMLRAKKTTAVKEGTGYSDEEVKSGKQRSGRPHPEARFPGWKVGQNMLTQKVKNGKKIGVARTIAAVREETERAAEARHKRLMKMDIPGTFGDRDLRERIRAKRERQKQQQAAKAAAAKKSVSEEIEQVDELSKPLLKRYISKAHFEGGMADFRHGRTVGKHDTMKNTQAKQNKRGELARISYKRSKGIDRAADKLSR